MLYFIIFLWILMDSYKILLVSGLLAVKLLWCSLDVAMIIFKKLRCADSDLGVLELR